MKWLYTGLVIVAPLLMGATDSPVVSTTASEKELRYVDTPYGWPFAFKNGQQLIGIFPNLMELIAEDLHFKVTTLMAPDVRTIEQIHQQHADATTIVTYQSPISADLKREDYPDFIHTCETPLITGPMALISIRSIPELEGPKPSIPNNLTIGILRFSSTGSFLNKPFNSEHKIFQFNSTALMLKSFIAGRIDAFIGDPTINIRWANHLAKKNLSVIEYPIGDYQILLALAKDWNNENINDLCAAITRYYKNGTIEEIQSTVIKGNPPPQ